MASLSKFLPPDPEGLAARLEKSGLSKAAFAEAIGVSRTTLDNMLAGERIKKTVMQKLEELTAAVDKMLTPVPMPEGTTSAEPIPFTYPGYDGDLAKALAEPDMTEQEFRQFNLTGATPIRLWARQDAMIYRKMGPPPYAPLDARDEKWRRQCEITVTYYDGKSPPYFTPWYEESLRRAFRA